jgi:hypothetical protein
MKVLSEWWKTVKDHEGMLQVLGSDPAGNVSEGYLVDDRTYNAFYRITSCFACFIMDQRKKGARTSRNFMISVSDAARCQA